MSILSHYENIIFAQVIYLKFRLSMLTQNPNKNGHYIGLNISLLSPWGHKLVGMS